MKTFETLRLLMRPLYPEDQAFYCACYTDPILMQHIGDPLSLEAALRGFNLTLRTSSAFPVRNYTWVMQEKISGDSVGLLAMYCDQAKPEPATATLGTIMLSQFQNRGFTAEALKELANIVFGKTSLDALFIKHKIGNNAVGGVTRKLGYVVDINNPDISTTCLWILRRNCWEELGNSTVSGRLQLSSGSDNVIAFRQPANEDGRTT
jgi:RimJ/RimL family protein N-acetyltransferase